MKYDHKQVEKKWQDIWDEKQCFKAENGSDKEKFYALVEFPYPSGQGLHVGHPRSYTALDIVARKKRMQGYNVLYPMGWDAFGLPTENFAIKNHVHPAEVTKKNIARFKSQLKSLGLSFDWSREINTTDPSYYKWTQWIFLQLFKKGLAYKKEMSVNWCTSCKCVLANEEVVNGVCERCGSEVVHKTKSQWMLAITKYAQRLIDDLDDVNYIERVKIQQKNWIGRSTGAEVDFKTTEGDTLTVYTTRPDTLFGATYMVISPEHPMIEQWADKLNNIADVRAYREEAARKSDFERTELNKDKTGVKLEGVAAINPVNGKQIPIFVSDYVLMGYGTGAIMAVPAHDDRDWEFAKKFVCEIIEVVSGKGTVQAARLGILPSALLGRADPDRQVRQVRLRSAAGGSASARAAERAHLRADRQRRIPARAHDRLGEHHLSVLRRPGKARDRHHAAVGRLLLVLPALYGPAQRQGAGISGSAQILVAGRLVQRRHGAYHAASAVQPLLAQVPV